MSKGRRKYRPAFKAKVVLEEGPGDGGPAGCQV